MEERIENLQDELEFNDTFRFKDEPDESTPLDADYLNVALNNTSWLKNILINDNAGSHNAIFRGKDVTKYFDDDSLWERISSGKFTDLFVGDYIVKNNITWRIAAFDYHLNKNDSSRYSTHHAVIVPDHILTKARMNNTNSTVNGVVNSEMYTITLNNVLTEYITPIFGDHVLEFEQFLTTGINSTGYNRKGDNSGCSNSGAISKQKISLMNENQVYGSIVWSSSGFDTGCDNTQFSLFNLAPQYINWNRTWYWLRSIVDSSRYANVFNNSLANRYSQASDSTGGVRPYFYID